MEQQVASSLSFVQFADDKYLNELFEVVQDQKNQHYHSIHINQGQSQELNYDITVNPQQIDKGYESQEGPKKNKNKKIKKKKFMFIQKEQETKKRRVKIYIESLENRVNQLQTQNAKLKKINQLNIGYIKKLNDSEQIINGFFVDRQKIFQRLEKLIETQPPESVKIQMQCDALSKRQGAFGKERMRALNYYFKLLLNLIIPHTQKYIAQAAYNSTDIFSSNQNRGNDTEKFQCMKKVLLSDEIIQRLVERQQDLIKLKTKFNEKVLDMYNRKCELTLISRQMEMICESFSQEVSNLAKAKFLCYSQKARVEDNHYPHDLKEMYDQLQKCSKFSYGCNSTNKL